MVGIPISPRQYWHPLIQAWQLWDAIESQAPDDQNVFNFQFNPSDMTVTHAADWQTKDVTTGRSLTVFNSTKPKIFKFDMFINQWGNHANVGSTDKSRLAFHSVESQISWLEARMRPTKRNGNLYSPPVLIFFWRVHVPVILTDMVVKRLHFRPSGFYSPDATQDSGRLKTGNRRTARSFNIDDPALPTDPPRANDAIRATVSITLSEFITSSQNDRSGSNNNKTASGGKVIDQNSKLGTQAQT